MIPKIFNQFRSYQNPYSNPDQPVRVVLREKKSNDKQLDNYDPAVIIDLSDEAKIIMLLKRK